VRATAKLDVVRRRLTARRTRHDMVEFQESRLLAAVTFLGDERATFRVTRRHLASHRGRDVMPNFAA